MECLETEDCGGMVWSAEDLECTLLFLTNNVNSHMIKGPDMTEVHLEKGEKCIQKKAGNSIVAYLQ